MDEVTKAYNRTKQKALDEGIPHEAGCQYGDRNIPHGSAPCNCADKWWFREALAAGRELYQKEQKAKRATST